MKIYNIYSEQNKKLSVESAVFIKDGFSIYAAIFQIFWFLHHKMWLHFIVFAFIMFGLSILYDGEIITQDLYLKLDFFIIVVIGCFANTWRVADLEKKKFQLHDVICEKDLDNVKMKYFARCCSTENHSAYFR